MFFLCLIYSKTEIFFPKDLTTEFFRKDYIMYNVHALQTVALREGPEKEIEVCEGMSR